LPQRVSEGGMYASLNKAAPMPKLPLFYPELNDALVDRHGKHAEFIEQVFADESMRELLKGLMLEAVYSKVRAAVANIAVL
jgi:hypothetical protein